MHLGPETNAYKRTFMFGHARSVSAPAKHTIVRSRHTHNIGMCPCVCVCVCVHTDTFTFAFTHIKYKHSSVLCIPYAVCGILNYTYEKHALCVRLLAAGGVRLARARESVRLWGSSPLLSPSPSPSLPFCVAAATTAAGGTASNDERARARTDGRGNRSCSTEPAGIGSQTYRRISVQYRIVVVRCHSAVVWCVFSQLSGGLSASSRCLRIVSSVLVIGS